MSAIIAEEREKAFCENCLKNIHGVCTNSYCACYLSQCVQSQTILDIKLRAKIFKDKILNNK